MPPKKLIIVNRHYPPNPGITGESAWDLAKYLIEKHQVEVHIVNTETNDDGGGQVRASIGITHSISTLYRGKNTIFKFISSFLEGYFLINKAKKIANNAPIICMTSPPLLPMWASILLKDKRWILWSMDLFPEAYLAIGVLTAKSFLYKWFLKKTYQNPPQKLIALGLKQAAFIEEQYGKVELQTSNFKLQNPESQTPIILPCGVLFHQEYETEMPTWKKLDGKIYFGYCGNINDAHNEDFLMNFIELMNPEKHQLVLALYGNKAKKVLDFAQNRAGITILSNVPRSQLNHLDIHLVSLLPKYTHLMIPSKAVSAVGAGGTILFCGSEESDNWFLLKNAGWLIAEKGNLGTQIKNFLEKITFEELQQKKVEAQKLNIELQKMVQTAYQAIADLV